MNVALPCVLVTQALPQPWLAKLRGHCELHETPPDSPGLFGPLAEHLARTEGLLSMLTDRVDAEALSRMPKLRVVSNMAVGVDNIDLGACRQRSVAVGHTPGVLTDATADLAFGLLLSAARRLPQASEDARQGRWGSWSPTGWLGQDLQGATLGIVGMGRIGTAVARRAQPFGMRVVFSSRSQRANVPAGCTQVPFDELLRQSDFVSLHVPLSSQTRHLLDAAALQRMKPGALLINTARGEVVDQDALLAALKSGSLGGAALDVVTPEPLPKEHPLYSVPNCLIAPHIGSATVGTRRRMAELACDNLLAGLRGAPLPHRAA